MGLLYYFLFRVLLIFVCFEVLLHYFYVFFFTSTYGQTIVQRTFFLIRSVHVIILDFESDLVEIYFYLAIFSLFRAPRWNRIARKYENDAYQIIIPFKTSGGLGIDRSIDG